MILECLAMVAESDICDGQQFLEARLDQQVPLDSQRQPPELRLIGNAHGGTKGNTDVDSADVLLAALRRLMCLITIPQ